MRISADTIDLDAFIRGMPKAELHMHLEGSIEAELLLELAVRNGLRLRWDTPEALRAAYRFTNLQSFLDLYYEGCRVLVHERDFYDITRAYLRRAHADAVIHAEVFIAPQNFIERGVSVAAVMDGVLAAMRDAAGEHGISAGLLVIAQRHRSEAEALRLLDQVMPWADRIAGFGLGGAELGNPPSQIRALLPRLPRARLPRHRTCGRGRAGVLCARGDRTAGGGPHRSRQCLPRRSGAGARTGGARHSSDGLPALECPAEGGAVAGGASAARHAGRRALS